MLGSSYLVLLDVTRQCNGQRHVSVLCHLADTVSRKLDLVVETDSYIRCDMIWQFVTSFSVLLM